MKAIVVLNSDHRDLRPDESTLLARARGIAERSEHSLELLHIVHDTSLTGSIFRTDAEIDEDIDSLLTEERRWVARLAAALSADGIDVATDVRWDHPRADAIVRKSEEEDVVLVLKEARDDRFHFGIFSNTDWELVRQSAAPMWFVRGTRTPLAGVVAAIDQVHERARDSDERDALDDAVFRCARAIAHDFDDAALHIVHAYEPPRRPDFEAYTPLLKAEGVATATGSEESDEALALRAARRHGEALTAFAHGFDFPVEDIDIAEGPTHEVVTEAAERHGAGVIVMGATSKNAWARVFGDAHAEPTLAEAPCDVVVVTRRAAVEGRWAGVAHEASERS